jgi:peptidoglycan/LPS O-acetylase OafA/YrhL
MLVSTQQHNATARNRYPGLDGLRAIAVFMVFLQHYASEYATIFGWGWTGVDIFFVLSGFLITGILYDSQDQPFRYRDFYLRRTLRIFPLYYAVWLAVLLVTPLTQWQWNWRWLLWPAYLGNYSRFLFLHWAGNPFRFDQLICGPLVQHWINGPMHLNIGHFWSLCVEEQFYLIWPLVVYQVRKRETLMKICIGVIIATPLLRWWLTTVSSPQMLGLDLLYRITPTRIDALLIGGLAALCLRGPQREWLHRWKHALLGASAALFVIAYLLADYVEKIPYQGSPTTWISIYGFTLIDLFAAALILETIHPDGWWSRLLSRKGLRNFGVISYGFYVFHEFPHDVYSYLTHRFFSGSFANIMTFMLAFFASWLVAWLSYRVLEYPMLKLKDRFTHQTHKAPEV